MSRSVINSLKRKFKLPIKVCEDCRGEGEITTFCGHDVQEYCRACNANGYKVIKKKKKKKLILDCKTCYYDGVPGASHDIDGCYGCGQQGVNNYKKKSSSINDGV